MRSALPACHADLAVDLEAADGVEFTDDAVKVAADGLEVVRLEPDGHTLAV